MMINKEREALALCICDARRQRLGVCASTSRYAALIKQFDYDMREARRLSVIKYSPQHGSHSHLFIHKHVEIVIGHDLKHITVAGYPVYYRSGMGVGVGGEVGEHQNLTIGDSLLPGIWWNDVREAADELRVQIKMARLAEVRRKAVSTVSTRAAHTLLAGRIR